MLNRVAFMGGVERVIVTGMKLLAERGFEPLLGCPGAGELPDAVRAHGFEVVPVEFDRMRSTLNPSRLAEYAGSLRREGARVRDLVRDRGVDVLHPHHPVAAAYGVRAVRELGVPMLLHVHETPPVKPLFALTMRYVRGVVGRYVCVSQASRGLLRELRVPDDRVRVVYNGVHPSFLGPPPPPAADVLASGPGPHVGLFGVIEPRKAQHIFLEAAAALADRHPTAHFWVVGALAYANHEAYRAQVEALAEAEPLRGRVTFTGFRPDVASLMMAMDAIALASVAFDALPTVCIEALTLGRRLVATAVGGVPEIVRDGVTGRVVPPGDARALAEGISDLLRRGPEDPMSAAAMRDMRDRFSPDRFGDDLAAVLRETLSRPAAPG
jgi:glycosyltransferase involved in cell wall biosynthesis